MSRRGAKAALAALSLAVSLGLGAAAAVAAPGDLDPTFGDAGKVDTGDGGYFPDVAVDHQGRIVMLANQKILRFDPDGQPDQSFGTDGVADYPPISALGSVAVASDDGILVG